MTKMSKKRKWMWGRVRADGRPLFFGFIATRLRDIFQLSRCSFWVRAGGLLVRGRRWELVRGSSLCRDKCDLAAHVPAILAKTRRTRLAAELIISVFVARGTLGAQPRLRVYRA